MSLKYSELRTPCVRIVLFKEGQNGSFLSTQDSSFCIHGVQNNSMLVEGHDMNCRRWKNCPLSVFQALNIQNLVLTLVNVDISAFEKVKFCIVTLSNTKLSKKYIN